MSFGLKGLKKPPVHEVAKVVSRTVDPWRKGRGYLNLKSNKPIHI
jgi:hypothetical protein